MLMRRCCLQWYEAAVEAARSDAQRVLSRACMGAALLALGATALARPILVNASDTLNRMHDSEQADPLVQRARTEAADAWLAHAIELAEARELEAALTAHTLFIGLHTHRADERTRAAWAAVRHVLGQLRRPDLAQRAAVLMGRVGSA